MVLPPPLGNPCLRGQKIPYGEAAKLVPTFGPRIFGRNGKAANKNTQGPKAMGTSIIIYHFTHFVKAFVKRSFIYYNYLALAFRLGMADRHKIKNKLHVSVSSQDMEKLQTTAKLNGYSPSKMAELLITWVTEVALAKNWRLKPRHADTSQKLLIRIGCEAFKQIQQQSQLASQSLGHVGSVHLQWGIWASSSKESSHLVLDKEAVSKIFSRTMTS